MVTQCCYVTVQYDKVQKKSIVRKVLGSRGTCMEKADTKNPNNNCELKTTVGGSGYFTKPVPESCIAIKVRKDLL